MVRFGFSTLDVLPYAETFRAAEGEPVDFVEIRMNDVPATTLREEADRITGLADEIGLAICVHLPHGDADLMAGSADPDVRARSVERFEDELAAAARIGAETAVVHIDAREHRLLLEVGEYETLAETVDHLAGVAADAGIDLSIENMRGTSRRRLWPDDVARLADDTGVSMTLDTGHARTIEYSDSDIVRFIERHGELVSHLHLNDTRGPTDEHLPFGAGTTDFRCILGAFSPTWRGTIDLEVKVADVDYLRISARKLADAWDTLDREATD